MTDILAEAIQVAQEMSDGSGAWSLAECVEAALKSAYPRDPSAAVIEAMAKALIHDRVPQPIRRSLLEQALAAYRAHPLWIALYATSPSETR